MKMKIVLGSRASLEAECHINGFIKAHSAWWLLHVNSFDKFCCFQIPG